MGRKRRDPCGSRSPDIRRFLGTPASSPRKPRRTPLSEGGPSLLATPSAATGNPPPETETDCRHAALPPRISVKTISTSSPACDRSSRSETPDIITEATKLTQKHVEVSLPLRRTISDVNKENGSGMAASSTGLKRPPSSLTRPMSGYFLVGPLPAKDDSSSGSGSSEDSEGAHSRRVSAEYALPIGHNVVGRDSVRDSFPANGSKIRIGVDAHEEGISRNQVTLQVSVFPKKIVLTNNASARNPIRVHRWAGPSAQSKQETAKSSAVNILGVGQKDILHPGDKLQLDGFRHPDRSKYSYIVHPLPTGRAASAGAADADLHAGGSASHGQSQISTAGQGSAVASTATSPRVADAGSAASPHDVDVVAPGDLTPAGEEVGSVRSRGETDAPSSGADEETVKKRRLSPTASGRQGGSPSTETSPSPKTTDVRLNLLPPGRVEGPDASKEETGGGSPGKRSRSDDGEGEAESLPPPQSKSPCHRSPPRRRMFTRRSALESTGAGTGAGEPAEVTDAPGDLPAQRFTSGGAGGSVASDRSTRSHTRRSHASSASGASLVGGTSGTALAARYSIPLTGGAPVLRSTGYGLRSGEGGVAPPNQGKEATKAMSSTDRGQDDAGNRVEKRSWVVGDVVELAPRLGKGSNKLGGVALVKAVYNDGTYLVKLVLTGAGATRVSSDLLSDVVAHEGVATRGRRSSRGAADPVPAAIARDATPVRDSVTRGERVRVLFDASDWYMGTVTQVHDDGQVTLCYDEGTEEKLELVPGSAERCADHDLAPVVPEEPASSSPGPRRASNAKRSTRASKKRHNEARQWRALGPWGGRVLSEGEGKVLTEARAKALLETQPLKLVGLEFRENIKHYGWWHSTVKEIIPAEGSTRGGAAGLRWPEAVMVETEQVEKSDGSDMPPLLEKRATSLLLRRLAAWDAERTPAAARLTGRRQGVREATQSRKSPTRKPSASKSPSRSAQGATSAPLAGASAAGGRGRGRRRASGAAAERRASPVTITNVTTEASRVRAKGSAGAAVRAPVGKPATIEVIPSAASPVEPAAIPAEETKKTSKAEAARLARAAAKAEAALERRAAEECGQATCPFCSHEFYKTEEREAVDAHLVECSRKAAREEDAEEEAEAFVEVKGPGQELAVAVQSTPVRVTPAPKSCAPFRAGPAETETARAGGAAIVTGRQGAIRRISRAVMSRSLSSTLMIELKGNELGSAAAAVEELAARGVRATVELCDRAMQEMLSSRCPFRTECLRRIMKSSLDAFPACWKPLNWGAFEETLQLLAREESAAALNAHTAIIEIILDCVEAHRRRQSAARKASSLPPLFLGAGGDQDGRVAVKRCAKWAAKAWSRRGPAALAGNEMEARVCRTMSRVLAESLEAFSILGAGGTLRELEGCQLAAVELEAHGEVDEGVDNRGATARCRASMLHSLGGCPYIPRLANVMLQNMPVERGDAEAERLRSVLQRHASRLGDGAERPAAASKSASKKRWASGSAMLFADLV